MRIFLGGTILTMRSGAPRAEALATDGERIRCVGGLDAVRASAPGAEEVDLNGACLLPGFIDAHHHFSEGAFFSSTVNLHWPAVLCVEDILRALADRKSEIPAGQWLIGQGYDETRLRERRGPSLVELDAAFPDHPVLLVQYSYHEAIVNSRAHEVLDLPLQRPDPPGGVVDRNRRGRPSGRMIENALAPFFARALHDALSGAEEDYFRKLTRYQDRLFASGLTRVTDAAVSPQMEHLLREAALQGHLRMPVQMMLSSADGTFMPPRDRLDASKTGAGADPLRTGALKIFMDGGERARVSMPLGLALGAGVRMCGRMLRQSSLAPLRAAALVPMRWTDRRLRGGLFFYSEAEARGLVEDAVGRGFSIAVHAEGNDAIDRTLRTLPRSPAVRSLGVPPHRIEHFFFPEGDAISRAADLGIATIVQPLIVETLGDRMLDMGVIGRMPFTPLRSMLDAGLTVAGSSDAPVVDYAPLAGIRAAVRRCSTSGQALDDAEQIRIDEALELYTRHAARSSGLEQEVGSLEAGKRADLVVLNSDPTTLASRLLDRLSVERTVCGGVDVYRSSTP